jgi:cytochrome c oxidase assembly protein subunit 15
MSEKRSIFQEVDASGPSADAPKGGMIDAGKRGARGAVRAWLMVLFALVVIMIAVGGLTRLTDSGLSITEWKPVTGALPPMDAATWEEEFDKYRAIPEYQLQNKGMSMAEFKVIYWWEWGHRQLGRFIGLVWALGFFGFLLTRSIPPGWTGRLLLLGALGWRAGRDRLVDGGLGPHRADARRGKLSFGHASRPRLRDPWVHRVVCVPSGS